VIQALSFTWTSADTDHGFAAVPTGNADAESGRTRSLVAKKTGRSVVTLALPTRACRSNVTRTETAVVGGVSSPSRDSTLTAINDTASPSPRVGPPTRRSSRASRRGSSGSLGNARRVVGAGDTIRFIARSNGPDTLIATHDFCLAGAKCADTVLRVSLSAHVALSAQFRLELATRSTDDHAR
jgi:hypothetical protein